MCPNFELFNIHIDIQLKLTICIDSQGADTIWATLQQNRSTAPYSESLKKTTVPLSTLKEQMKKPDCCIQASFKVIEKMENEDLRIDN